jgi:hypothetical protein
LWWGPFEVARRLPKAFEPLNYGDSAKPGIGFAMLARRSNDGSGK